ncbi:MAG: tryptophan synthase subunit alpha [Chthonomonas sp.]|nr:tryptophan synthase subunit alpha [Chthonomonas sp.]
MPTGRERLQTTFQQLSASGNRALICFVTAGDPSLEQLPEILDTLTAAGADVIEVGLPFSDPIADGPVIQASSQRALDRGVTTAKILDVLRQGAGRGWAPIILMGYYNPILAGGLDAMGQAIAEAGVCGTLVSDLPPGTAADWVATSERNGLANIFLLAPTSTPQRVDEVCAVASGFVYFVSRTGVTGGGLQLDERVPALIAATKSRTNLPAMIGFGISQPADVAALRDVADGVIVGSSLVKLLADGAAMARLKEEVSNLKAASSPR